MISIIIPSYNRAHSISNSIESVIAQSDPDWELIIFDDGSVDNTGEVVQKYLHDKRISYFYCDNGGVSAARNSGARLSKGNYLIFLDSDDTIDEGLIASLKKTNIELYDLICWEIKFVKDEIESIIKPKNLGALFNFQTAGFLAASVCYNKSLFFELGGYDEKLTFSENSELGMRFCKKKDLKICLIPKVLATYYIINAKRTSNSVSNRFYSYVHQYRKHNELFLSSRHENSKMIYFFGYLLESFGRTTSAYKFYKKSWHIAPWKLKPLIKIVYFRFFIV